MSHALRQSPRPGSTQLLPGAYFTDGLNLFAVLDVSEASGHEPLITFENCRTLELVTCTVGDLEHADPRLVRPAAA